MALVGLTFTARATASSAVASELKTRDKGRQKGGFFRPTLDGRRVDRIDVIEDVVEVRGVVFGGRLQSATSTTSSSGAAALDQTTTGLAFGNGSAGRIGGADQ